MKSSFSLILITVVTSVIAVVGCWKWYSIVADKSAFVVGLENQIVEKKEAASRVASAQSALKEIANDEKIIHNYFISDTNIVDFTNELKARGDAQGAKVNVLSVSTNASSTPPTFAISLEIKGTFEAVMRTIGVIEYAPYYLSISELSVEQDAGNSWRANLKILVGSKK